MSKQNPTRREFLAASGAAAASLAAGLGQGAEPKPAAESGKGGKAGRLTLGLPTYMFKHYTLDETLVMARRVAVRHICIRTNLLPLTSTAEEVKAAVAKVKDAGLVPYGGGVFYMRSAEQVQRVFEYVRAAGFGVVSISISPDLLGLLERKVKELDVRAAIHNHGPEDRHWPTPQAIYEKVKRFDRRIGICHDTGHTQRAGVDPVEATRKTADRTYDMHLKDVDAATGEGHSTELGRGVVDLPGIVGVLVKIGYRDVVGIEYEKHMKDLLPGLAESVGYARGLLDVLQRES